MLLLIRNWLSLIMLNSQVRLKTCFLVFSIKIQRCVLDLSKDWRKFCFIPGLAESTQKLSFLRSSDLLISQQMTSLTLTRISLVMMNKNSLKLWSMSIWFLLPKKNFFSETFSFWMSQCLGLNSGKYLKYTKKSKSLFRRILHQNHLKKVLQKGIWNVKAVLLTFKLLIPITLALIKYQEVKVLNVRTNRWNLVSWRTIALER